MTILPAVRKKVLYKNLKFLLETWDGTFAFQEQMINYWNDRRTIPISLIICYDGRTIYLNSQGHQVPFSEVFSKLSPELQVDILYQLDIFI